MRKNIIQFKLEKKNMTKYRLCKEFCIPYSTLENIILGRTKIEDVRGGILFKIARGLDCNIETLLKHPYITMDGIEGISKEYGIPFKWKFERDEYYIHFMYKEQEYSIMDKDMHIEKEELMSYYNFFASMMVDIEVKAAEIGSYMEDYNE